MKSIVAVVFVALLASVASGQNVETGKKQFEARCAGCHGADGAGGERGPGIVDIRPGRRRSQNLREIINNGIPDAGMPPFKLSDSEMEATLAFLGSLTAPAAQRPVDGAVDSGRQFFFGKGNCSSCHMIGGRGGVLGPDLSNLAAGRR